VIKFTKLGSDKSMLVTVSFYKGECTLRGALVEKVEDQKEGAIVVAVLFKLHIYIVKVRVHCLVSTTTALLQLLTALLEHFDHVQYAKRSDGREGYVSCVLPPW